MRAFLVWMFRNRLTGTMTVIQAPNLTLWTVMVAGGARLLLHPGERWDAALTILVRGGLMLWALDEILRGVNPWRRGLGGVVLCFELLSLRFGAR